jgi:DNA-binding NarL/FixJ family response regulator
MGKKNIKLLVVDQQPIVYEGIENALSKDRYHFHYTKNSEEARKALQESSYDLLIIDIYKEDRECFERIHQIIKDYAHLNVLLFTSIRYDLLLYDLYKSGCSIVTKQEASDYFIEGVKVALDGMNYLSPSVKDLRKINLKREKARPLTFTKQEGRILALTSIGLSSKEIAIAFELEKSSVDTYRRRLIKKFKVNNMAELIIHARAIHKL